MRSPKISLYCYPNASFPPEYEMYKHNECQKILWRVGKKQFPSYFK